MKEMTEWEQLKAVDVRTVRREDLVDITGLAESENLSPDKEARMRDFFKRVKNPYCFMVGDVIVKSSFMEGVSLQQRLQELAEGLA